MAVTVTATGSAMHANADEAVRLAVDKALQGLAGARPTYGFAFVSPKLPLSPTLRAIEKRVEGANIIGCHTAGEFNERGLLHGGVSVLLVASRNDSSSVAVASGVKASPTSAAAKICESAAALAKDPKTKAYAYPVSVALLDGLNGAGESLISSMVDSLAPLHRIVGGAAGDEGAFKTTLVGGGHDELTDGAAVLHVRSAKRWGVGVGHGLKPTTAKMQVTKAQKNVVYEIDNRPAFDVYKEHAAKRGITLKPESAGEYMIGNELGIYFLNELYKARAPLSVGADGSLSCAAEITQGASVCILDGDPSSMVAAATQAAKEAKEGLDGGKAAGVLVFDCICRGMIMKDKFQAEIDAVRGVFGEVPVAGFLTYGEIARYKGTLDGWHNTTAVVVAIPE